MSTVVLVSHPLGSRYSGYDLRVARLCAHTPGPLHLLVAPLAAEPEEPTVPVGDLFASVTVLEPFASERPRLLRHLRPGDERYLRWSYPRQFARAVGTLRSLIRRHQASRIVVFGGCLAELAEAAGQAGAADPAVVVDICDCVTLTAQRELELSADRSIGWHRGVDRIQLHRVRALERHIVRGPRAVVAISRPDADALDHLAGEPGTVHVVPNGVDPDYLVPMSVPGGRRGVVFWGNLAFRPNQQAIAFFLDHVYRPVLRPAGVEFCVVGPNAPSWLVHAAERDQGIVLRGRVDDLRSAVTEYPIMVNPMRTGSGLKNKVLEAFALGVVVVSTPLGVEALPGARDRTHLAVAADGPAFGAAVLSLLDDRSRLLRLRAAARRHVVDHYRWETVGQVWRAVLDGATTPDVEPLQGYPGGRGREATDDQGQPPELGPVLRRGVRVSAGALVVTQGITLLQTLVLARILSPEQVGIFYAGTVLATFLVTFGEGGLRHALIQRRSGVDEAANTVFWATLVASVGWALVALGAAPLVGLVFHTRDAGLVATATAGTVILHGLTNVPDALLQRRFDFRQKTLVQPGTALAFAVTSVLLCLSGWGVWGLVAAYYLSIVVWLALTWTLAGWRPHRGRASIRTWRELAGFGYPLVIRDLANRGKEILEAGIVGRFLTTATLGNYRYGSRIGGLPGLVVIQAGSYVLFPAFSRASQDPVRFRAAFLRALQALWLVAAPVGGLTAFLGLPLTLLLLGPPWRQAGLLVSAMFGVGLGVALAAVGLESIKGAGRTTLLNRVTGVEVGGGVLAFVALVRFGPVGIGAALSLSAVSSGLLSLVLARGVVGVRSREIATCLVPPAVAAAVAGLPWALVEHHLARSSTRGPVTGLTVLTAEALGYLLTYAALLLTISPTVRHRAGRWWSTSPGTITRRHHTTKEGTPQ